MELAIPILPADDLRAARALARTFSTHDPAGDTIFVMGPVAGGTHVP